MNMYVFLFQQFKQVAVFVVLRIILLFRSNKNSNFST